MRPVYIAASASGLLEIEAAGFSASGKNLGMFLGPGPLAPGQLYDCAFQSLATEIQSPQY